MAERYIEEARGALSRIPDRTTSKEIEKLWSVLEARLGGDRDQDHSLVTRADLKKELTGTPLTTPAPSPIGQGVIGGGGGKGDNLLPLDNVWTGSNTFTRTPVVGTPTLSLQSFQAGAVETGSALLTSTTAYNTLAEIVRSTKLPSETGGSRGISALAIQHKVTGPVNAQNTMSAIYAALETTQGGGAAATTWLWAGNLGDRTAVYGSNIIVYHAGVDGQTVGCEVDISRKTPTGNVAAFSAVIFGDDLNAQGNADSAYLAVSTGSPKRRFTSVFQAGHPDYGPLDCDIGLNLALATCTGAAICVPDKRLVTLSGLNQDVCFVGDGATRTFELRAHAQAVMRVSPTAFNYIEPATGIVLLGCDAATHQPIFGPASFTTSAGAVSGAFLAIQFGGGGIYKIPLYNYS